MDLDFTDEQEMLRKTVRGICEKHASLAIVREVEDDPLGYPDSFWAQLAEAGLVGLTIPEEYDGSAMTMLDAVVVVQYCHQDNCIALAREHLEGVAQRRADLPAYVIGEEDAVRA